MISQPRQNGMRPTLGRVGRIHLGNIKTKALPYCIQVVRRLRSSHLSKQIGMAQHMDWRSEEIALIVNDYMAMFSKVLLGQKLNKAEHNRELQKLISRSRGSIEFKHQNISAVLRDIDLPWLPGYKPLSNIQQALADEVVIWLNRHPELQQLIANYAVQKPVVNHTPPWQDFIQSAPEPSAKEPAAVYQVKRPTLQIDYAAREAKNSALGLAGEELVLAFEQQRLSLAGKDHLAAKVEHIAKTQGDGAGYDILSFETSGQERFIEVKTTTLAAETPFYLSRNELQFSQAYAGQYQLFRVYELNKKPRAFVRSGALDQSCRLEPIAWRGW